MAQDFEMIGKPSDEINAIQAQTQGWQNQPPAEDLGHEVTDSTDYSFRDRRANRQALGFGTGAIPSMAGYQETPMAAVKVTPPGDTQ